MPVKDKDPNGLNMNRRTFLKAAGVVGTVAAAGGGVDAVQKGLLDEAAAAGTEKYETFTSSCSMECLHCNLTALVKDGKVVKVEASDGFNTIGCLRGMSRTLWVNHPDRLKKPMLRTGEKGSGEFKEISWDEALDLIVEKLKETKSKYGNEGIFLTQGSGNMNAITGSTANAFFDSFGGCSRSVGSLCCSAVTAAMVPIFGQRTETRDTIKDSKYILCWGNNPAVTMQAYFKDYEEAMKKGAKLVVIDPRYSETAAKAHDWIPIIPGTDTALALGMANVIVQEKIYDRDFLIQHTGATYLVDTNGTLMRANPEEPESYLVFDTVSKKAVRHDTTGIIPALTKKETALPGGAITVFDLISTEFAKWPPEKVEEETDVPAETVIRIAREYAKTNPAMIIQNMSGAQRTENGTYVAASQMYLALLTGNIGTAGSGICDNGGVTQLTKIKPPVNVPKLEKELPKIPVAQVGNWIAHDKPNKIGFWWVMTSSPMTQNPNSGMMKKALKKVPFVVVADNFMTSTALYADLVLPICAIFEEVNLMAGIRSHYIQLMDKAVDPPGEAKPDYWIFTELAKRMGFGEAFDKPIEAYIESCLEGTGVTLEQIKKAPVRPTPYPYIPYEGGNFTTPTGKGHFYIEEWTERGYSPIVTYIRAVESIKESPDLAKKYPLNAIQFKQPDSVHSSFKTLKWVREAVRENPQVVIHPIDAEKRNIKDGDWVVVYNDRGEHKAIANVTAHIKQGVVGLENGWWEQQGGSSSYVNNDKAEPLGDGQACNDTLVNVRKEA